MGQRGPSTKLVTQMAGNSSRRGAVRKKKKQPGTGSGGQRRRGLEGKGPTPKAEDRTGHPAARKAQRRSHQKDREATTRREVILGRNAVDEALAAGVPGIELVIAESVRDDSRINRARAAASAADIPVVVKNKKDMDRLADGLPHQGIALQVAPFEYAQLHEVMSNKGAAESQPITVVLDHLQDGRNLGAIARSAAAFGATGLVIPSRRAAGVTAAAWRASAGALARLPVARVTNLSQTISSLQKADYLVVGLAATGGTSLPSVDADILARPVALVVGSEASGLSRLVASKCDLLVTIPIMASTESLNASTATAIALDRLRNS